MDTSVTKIPPSPSSSSPVVLYDYDYCFLCLTELKQSHQDRTEACLQGKAPIDKKIRYYVAVKHLIHSCNDTKDTTRQQLELINKLLSVLKLEGDERSEDNLCSECEKKVTELLKLHKVLELIKQKLEKTIKAMHELIIGSSVYGSDDSKKRQMEKLELWLQEQENVGKDCEVKKKREWLEAILEFQTAIFNKSEERNENTCPCQEKCNLVPLSSSVFKQLPETSESTGEDPLITVATDFDISAISTLVKTEGSEGTEDEGDKCFLESWNLDLIQPISTSALNRDGEIIQGKTNKRTRLTRGLSKSKRKTGKRKVKLREETRDTAIPVTKRKVKRKTSRTQDKNSGSKYATRMAVIIDKEKNVRTYKCEICDFGTPSMYTFIHHLRSHETDDKTYECQEKICEDRKFSGAQFFKLHKLHHVEGQYQWKCKICSKRISPPEYSKHLQTHGDGPVHQCEYCYYGSVTVVDFVNHLRYHHGVSPKCLFCEARIAKVAGQSTYAQHLHKEHGCDELVVPCDFDGCKETFYSSYAMHLHKNIHTKKFHCEKCTRSFSNSTAYKLHIQERHTKEKVHDCTVQSCGESFVTHAELERHLVSQHNMPKFRCKMCPDREYSNIRSLKVHERRHHQENLYSCDVCGKIFKNIAYCNKHKTIHGPRNVICEVCGFATTSQYQLQKHKVIHKAVPLHGCPHCPKRFNYRRAMEDHIRTHTGERPFVCHYCSAAFAQKGACMNQIRKIHEKNKSKHATAILPKPSEDHPQSSINSGQIEITFEPARLDSVIPSNPGEITYVLQSDRIKIGAFSEDLTVQTFTDGTEFSGLT